jgi:hypothetical protein
VSRWDVFRERFAVVARTTSVLRKPAEALAEAGRGLEGADDVEGRAAAAAIQQATQALAAAQQRLQALAARRLTPANREQPTSGLETDHG